MDKSTKKDPSTPLTSAQKLGREILQNRILDDSLAGKTFVSSSTLLSSRLRALLANTEQKPTADSSSSHSGKLKKKQHDTTKHNSKQSAKGSKKSKRR